MNTLSQLRIPHVLILTGLLLGSLCQINALPGDLIWEVATDGVIFGAPAIGPNGEIVVGTEIFIDGNETGDGSVYAFNPDGSTRWIFTGADDYFDSSPTIGADGTVYIGCWDFSLYALDGEDGSLKWSFATESLIVASPAIGSDGTLFVGSYDGSLYAINPDGTERWTFSPPSDLTPINGSPVLSHNGDTVYYGTDAGNLFAIRTSSGTQRWVYSLSDGVSTTSDAISSAPAIGVDGTIYVGSENARLYSISATGGLNWSYLAAESIRSSPILDADDTIYFAAQDGYLYSLSPEGYQLWEAFVGDVFYCTPALDADGNIVIGAYAGSATLGAKTVFVAVNTSGEYIWDYTIDGVNDSSPNIAPDGSVYIGAHDGNLYKLEGSAPLATDGWPRFQGTRRQTGFIEDLTLMEMVDFFPSLAASRDGWIDVPWFGSGWLTEIGLPWIFHEDHGFLYVLPADPSSAYVYDSVIGEWLLASEAYPEFLYRTAEDSWLYHWPGSTYSEGRWFFDYSAPNWVSAAQL